MSMVIKDARGNLSQQVVVITKLPEINQARLQIGDRGVVVVDDQREDGLVMVELLHAPRYRVYLAPENFEPAPVEN